MQVVQFDSSGNRFITEMDLLRLQKALLLARMSANSTFLVDKQPPGFSTKLERLSRIARDAVRRAWPEANSL